MFISKDTALVSSFYATLNRHNVDNNTNNTYSTCQSSLIRKNPAMRLYMPESNNVTGSEFLGYRILAFIPLRFENKLTLV